MVRRLIRLVLATASLAVIATLTQPSPATAGHSCYACLSQCTGVESQYQAACETGCGGGTPNGCMTDIYGFCDGGGSIVKCDNPFN
jgi:hypothetical protein